MRSNFLNPEGAARAFDELEEAAASNLETSRPQLKGQELTAAVERLRQDNPAEYERLMRENRKAASLKV